MARKKNNNGDLPPPPDLPNVELSLRHISFITGYKYLTLKKAGMYENEKVVLAKMLLNCEIDKAVITAQRKFSRIMSRKKKGGRKHD